MEIVYALLIGFLAIIALEIVVPFIWGLFRIIGGVLVQIWHTGYGTPNDK